ncbi:glycosyltransferase family 1 protein [Ramaria rubella]|nr:glycosyltransferase family 1 protein [Ramaria rubella]
MVVSGHVLMCAAPAWGHLKPLCGFACRIVMERPGIVVTIIIVGDYRPRMGDLEMYFPETGSDSDLKRNIRIISAGGEGLEPYPLMPVVFQNVPAYCAKLLDGERLQCHSTGETYNAIREPNVAVVDFFFLEILQAIRVKAGKRIPIYAWLCGQAGAAIRALGPEKIGGFGNVGQKARAQAEATGRPFEVIIEELYRPSAGELITVPGLPTMYDYEWFPQVAPEGLPKGILLANSYTFGEVCDGFVAVSSSISDAEAVDATRAWLAETNRPFYAVGPLTPPGFGGMLSETSKKAEVASSQNGDEFEVFLDKMLKEHGEISIIYISFGTMW